MEILSGMSSLSKWGDIRIGSRNFGTVHLSDYVHIQTGDAYIGSYVSMYLYTRPIFGGKGVAKIMIVRSGTTILGRKFISSCRDNRQYYL